MPRLAVSAADVLVSGLKPCEDGKGWLVRLFGAGGKDRQVTLTWRDPQPASLWMSGTAEQRGAQKQGAQNGLQFQILTHESSDDGPANPGQSDCKNGGD